MAQRLLAPLSLVQAFTPGDAARSALTAIFLLLPAMAFAADSFKAAGAEFEAARNVVLPADAPPVVVVEFLHHGQIAPEGRNVAVEAKNHELAPVRVLQVGPGDFCRLAFEPIKHQTHYTIFYGGEAPAAGKLPPWTAADGLLLETRRYKDCNLRRFESVREAFESAEPLAAGYVDTVHHAGNPFLPARQPFLSRYHGRLYIDREGQYTFWTTSQDCSFLRIDGRPVAEAPGRHGPEWRALPGNAKTLHLTAGPHEFDYYHAAAGDTGMMVAAWISGPPSKTARPAIIPREAFHAAAIGRATPGPPEARKASTMPDFTFTVAGDVPLPDNPTALVAVSFKDASPQNLAYGTSVRWDFGDGQTSDQAEPVHVFLRPGLYQVTLSHRRGGKTASIANRIEVDRPVRTWASQERAHALDDYLPLLKTYDAKTLDAPSAIQLVSAYLWKADQIAASLEPKEPDDAADASADTARNRGPRRRPAGTRRNGVPGPRSSDSASRSARGSRRNRQPVEMETKPAADASPETLRLCRQLAVDAGRAALVDGSNAKGDDAVLALARMVADVARFDLGDSPAALALWEAAAGRVNDPHRRAECQVEAADVAANDLLDPRRARALLDAAAKGLPRQDGPLASRLFRIRGDCLALAGEGPAARKAYDEAQRRLAAGHTNQEQTAHRGARSRSTEAFLRAGQWDRAARELDRWQDEFPGDKPGGYLSLLYARYWIGREKYGQAIALAEALVATSPDSPYADQLLYLAALAESKQGRPERAVAILNQLLKDYPGSPLAPEVKRRLQE